MSEQHQYAQSGLGGFNPAAFNPTIFNPATAQHVQKAPVGPPPNAHTLPNAPNIPFMKQSLQAPSQKQFGVKSPAFRPPGPPTKGFNPVRRSESASFNPSNTSPKASVDKSSKTTENAVISALNKKLGELSVSTKDTKNSLDNICEHLQTLNTTITNIYQHHIDSMSQSNIEIEMLKHRIQTLENMAGQQLSESVVQEASQHTENDQKENEEEDGEENEEEEDDM